MFDRQLLNRLNYILYFIAPLVSGFDSFVMGRYELTVLYGMVSVVYLIAFILLKQMPPRINLIMQTMGAVLLIIISYDMFRMGRDSIPYLYIFTAVMNLYTLWFGERLRRRREDFKSLSNFRSRHQR
jgi:hypothetical protein